MKLRSIAFVLPQFHPIPENDEWWGKGFTEWTNVTKAKPLFKGHYQPHLPTDLGFYDLRLPEARKAQADLAKEYGIHGFCYYHYWFNGKRLLNQPIDGMLQQKELDMPFMLCWANENWTRRWDGKDEEVLIKQDYSFEDDKAHMRWLCGQVFSDKRYIRVNDMPVFVVYRHSLFPDFNKTVAIWRDIAIKEFGFPDLYLCITESFVDFVIPKDKVFDAIVEFAPHRVIKNRLTVKNKKNGILVKLGFKEKSKDIDFRDFNKGVDQALNRPDTKYKLYRCVTPAWDNTARMGDEATVSKGSSPDLYYYWLYKICSKFRPYSKDENFVFINAMNEWAEGNHLEPCIKYSRAYLEATRKALSKFI